MFIFSRDDRRPRPPGTSWLRMHALERLVRLWPVIALLWLAVAWALGDAA